MSGLWDQMDAIFVAMSPEERCMLLGQMIGLFMREKQPLPSIAATSLLTKESIAAMSAGEIHGTIQRLSDELMRRTGINPSKGSPLRAGHANAVQVTLSSAVADEADTWRRQVALAAEHLERIRVAAAKAGITKT